MDDSESTNVDGTRSVPKEQLLPMGAVTRRTGIGEHTLRVWERRFGFPQPLRLPSGHRRYPMDQVHQLTMIHEALRCGYRAGDVVPLPREKLAALLEECGQDSESEESSRGWLHEIFEAAEKFDRTVVKKALYQAAGNLGLPRFLRERVTPLLSEIGEAWSRGDIEIRHEHFISEVLDEVLRDLRRPLEETANGRPVVLAGLEYEHHVLGQHVAALAVATAGRDCLVLGAETPAEEIARTAVSVGAAAVGISISAFAEAGATLAEIRRLRKALPAEMLLWLGGSGATSFADLPAGTEVLDSLDALDRALRRLGD